MVWIKPTSNGYCLPGIKIEPKVWPSDFSLIEPEIEQEFKIDVHILHYTDLKIERSLNILLSDITSLFKKLGDRR